MREAHGMYGTPAYISWQKMMDRCKNPKNNRYHKYGGSGITVCPSWTSFTNFYRDMGDRPPGTTLDRIDNTKGYTSGNCRWATAREQAINRGTTHWVPYQGETLPLKELATKLGMKRLTLYQRLKKGWSLEAAIQTPIRKSARWH